MPTKSPERLISLLYATTIFLSAFLLFQVQPLIGKFILPWFGGSPAVWTTCMLVFQVLLFGGYAYAHATTQYLPAGRQLLLHVGLLAFACCLLPITPDAAWKPQAQDTPVWRIILLTICSVGVPYFILSSTGPLVQGWFSRTLPNASPYRLYSLSNLGSLLALLSYPFFVERTFATPTQAVLWSIGFGLFAVLCASCAGCMWANRASAVAALADPMTASDPNDSNQNVIGLWFGLAMLPSVLLLAMTNQVCLDVAVIPFLWVVPLAIYLATFILAFDATGWYSRQWYSLASAVAIALTCLVMFKPPGTALLAQLIIYFAALFCCCMVCHGELVRLKPHPRCLTKYYLTISAGGAAGGLFVGLAAPVLFTGYYELHLAFVAFGLLYMAVKTREEHPELRVGTRWAYRLGNVGVLCTVGLLMTQMGSHDGAIAVARNFYGVLRVTESDSFGLARHRRELVHGRIVHGSQFLSPGRERIPTTYYGVESGIGKLLNSRPNDHSSHIGVIGLGIGSLANYARPGDQMRFYEINPDVIDLAQRYFTCLKNCRGQATVITGDARLVLEHETPQAFDVLVLDAFSGDAIPVHLLTKEAWQIYLKHLKPDGILACHISNLHFDLKPVLAGLAEDIKWSQRVIVSDPNPSSGTQTAHWCLMSRHPATIDAVLGPLPQPVDASRKILWTDDCSNLFEVLQRPVGDAASIHE